jgi:MFS family permease
MTFINHPIQLVGLRAFIGVLGGISVATLAAVTTTSPRQVLGRNIGILQASQTLGQVAGPLVGGGIAVMAGLRPTFIISALLFGLGFGLVTWLYRDVSKAAPPEPRPARARPTERLATSVSFWATLVVLFSASFIDGSFMATLPLYLPMLGAPGDNLALLAGLGLSGGALAMAVSAAAVGRLSGRVAHGTLVLVLLGGASIALLAVVLAGQWWQLLALRALIGLMAGGLPTLGYALAAGLVPSNRQGAVVGLASTATSMGWAVAPLAVGALIGIDPRAVYLLDLALLVACAVILTWSGAVPSRRSLAFARRHLVSPLR